MLQVEHARPRDKSYKVFDGRGLYLEVTPQGGRLWRFKYRIAGKEKRIALGIYPDVGLKGARERLDAARRQVAAGFDPNEQRKAEKIALAQKMPSAYSRFQKHGDALSCASLICCLKIKGISEGAMDGPAVVWGTKPLHYS